jgi:hypothetical protein
MSTSDKCSDCSNNVTTEAGEKDMCKAPSLQGVLEQGYQKDQSSKSIPSATCRAVKILCAAEARWFAPK